MRTATIALLSAVLLLLSVGGAIAQDSSPEMGQETAAVDAGIAEAHVLEAHVDLAGRDMVDISPTPAVLVEVHGSGIDNARDSIVDMGPIPGTDASIAEAQVAKVTADVSLGSAPVARGVAEVIDAEILPVATGVLPTAAPAPLVTADIVRAEATATCGSQTPQIAAAGSQVVGLSVAGRSVDVPAGTTTVVEVPGVVRVTVLGVYADQQGKGWTVRGLHVESLDPATGVAAGEVTVSETHVALACDSGPDTPEEPPPLVVDKAVRDDVSEMRAGDTFTYEISVTNATGTDCVVHRLTDVVPVAFDVVSTGGALGEVEPQTQADGRRLVYPLGVALAPQESLVATLTVMVPEGTAPGTYRNLARAFGVCGIGSSGFDAPVTVIVDDQAAPCDNAVDPARDTDGSTQFAQLTGTSPEDFTVRVSGALLDHADSVVIARQDLFPDALAASGLAAELCAPLLVNPVEELSPVIRDELARLSVSDVYLVGGPAALSPVVEAQLGEEGYRVERVGGATRYDTAIAVANRIVDLGGLVDRVTVARADLFPDAMSGANLATWRRAPILLSDPTGLPAVTAAALPTLLSAGARDVYVAGGLAAIAEGVAEDLAGGGYTVRRLAGDDRFATSRAVLEEVGGTGSVRERSPDVGTALFNPAYIASGDDFVSALVGGVAAYLDGGTLLLVNPDDLTRSPAAHEHLRANASTIDFAAMLGSTRAISALVEQQVLDAIRSADELT